MADRDIREAVEKMSGTHLADKVYSIEAAVNSVDAKARTCVCTVVSGRANNTFYDVKLMSSVDDGFLIIPTVGSTVNIILSDYTDPYISQYSGIDSIIFRGGDLGGMVKVITLTAKLNNVENKVNDLITKFAAHVHPVIAVGSPTGPNATPVIGVLVPTQQTEIENKNITHG